MVSVHRDESCLAFPHWRQPLSRSVLLGASSQSLTTAVKLWRVEPGARFSCSCLVLRRFFRVLKGSLCESRIQMGARAARAHLLFRGSGFLAASQGRKVRFQHLAFPCCCRSGHPASCHLGCSAAAISTATVLSSLPVILQARL